MLDLFKPITGECMKSFLNTVLASVAMAAPAFAVVQDKCAAEENVPRFKSRISVSPTSLSFERMSEDSWSFGFEYFTAPAFRAKNLDVTTGVASVKVGYGFAIDPRSRVTASVGASMFREENTATIYAGVRDQMGVTLSREITVKNPYLIHGTVGFGAEYDLMKTLTLGLNVHGMGGQVWGGTIDKMGDMSWGLNMSLPLTFRFGQCSQWDARFEPFTYLLRDYANYVGGKAALGYRF